MAKRQKDKMTTKDKKSKKRNKQTNTSLLQDTFADTKERVNLKAKESRQKHKGQNDKKKSKSQKRIKQTKASLLLDELADTLASKKKR